MSYYDTHKDYFKKYYKEYYLKHREIQIKKSTEWYLASEEHRIRHAKACKKYLMKNKESVYSKRRIKSFHNILMKELLDRFMYN